MSPIEVGILKRQRKKKNLRKRRTVRPVEGYDKAFEQKLLQEIDSAVEYENKTGVKIPLLEEFRSTQPKKKAR